MRTVLMTIGGAAVGAGLGLLFSPAGNRTRKLIADKTVKCTHDTQDLLMSKARHLRNKAKGLKHHAGEFIQQSEGLTEACKTAAATVSGLVSQGQELLEHGKDVIEKAKSSTTTSSVSEPVSAV
jgi:gas vesicle protein